MLQFKLSPQYPWSKALLSNTNIFRMSEKHIKLKSYLMRLKLEAPQS